MWESGTEQEVEDAFNRYANWTPEGVQLLQEAHLGGDIGALCIADDIGVSLIAHCIINLCTYQAPELCPVDPPTPAGAAAIVGNLVVLIGLVALALLLL